MKSLMLSTAILAAGALAATAQDAATPATGSATTAAAGAGTGSPMQAGTMFRTAAEPGDIRASDFVGMRIYSSEQAGSDTAAGTAGSTGTAGGMAGRTAGGTNDQTEGAGDAAWSVAGRDAAWEDIGEVGDVIFGRDGRVEAVIVDIGGFLGMGEHPVAVNMDQIHFVADEATADDEQDYFLVVTASRGQLEQAPAYADDRARISEGDADTAAAQGTDGATAPARSAGTGMAANDMTAGGAGGAGARQPADASQMTAEDLTGATVYGMNDEAIGNVSQILLTPNGRVDGAVIDVGGFLGIGAKPVALSMQQLQIMRQDGGDDIRVQIDMSREDLEQMPRHQG